jgi:hypothetical protein
MLIIHCSTEVSLLSDPDSSLYKSTFQAVPQLERSDADVSLLFLAQNVSYTGPIDDPWFYAKMSVALVGGQTQKFYGTAPDSPVSVVGCTEQHQLCNPVTSQCTGLSGLSGVLHHKWDSLGFNERQIATYNRSFAVASDSILSATTQILGAKHMLVQNYVGYGNAATLPSNQWILELNNWFGTMMTNLQLRSLQYATGPSSTSFFKYIQQPETHEEQEMCSHQIIRRNDFASFNILGLAIIFIVGGLMIILNLTLSTIVNKIQQATPKGQHRIREWDINGTLKLQRIAFQNHGAALRTGGKDPTPITTFEQNFENKLPSMADASKETKPARSTLSRFLSPKANQTSFAEIKDLGNEPPASATLTTPGSGNEITYTENDPWKGRLFDHHHDSKPVG